MTGGTGLTPAAVEVVRFLDGMVGGDGYGVSVHDWPADDRGRARLEIVPRDGACADCLVPKGVVAAVLAPRLPPGLVIEEDDLIYPSR